MSTYNPVEVEQEFISCIIMMKLTTHKPNLQIIIRMYISSLNMWYSVI